METGFGLEVDLVEGGRSQEGRGKAIELLFESAWVGVFIFRAVLWYVYA